MKAVDWVDSILNEFYQKGVYEVTIPREHAEAVLMAAYTWLNGDNCFDMGRAGGLVGGPARAKALSKERRREIASKAAQTRWGKHR